MDNLPLGSTLYICGPMTGRHCFNFEVFFYWAAVLKKSGYKIINPAEHDCLKMLNGWVYTPDKYEEVLAHDLMMIEKSADALFVLEGWEESRGAKREICKADELGKPIYYETDRRN